jgi:hypothetical protein
MAKWNSRLIGCPVYDRSKPTRDCWNQVPMWATDGNQLQVIHGDSEALLILQSEETQRPVNDLLGYENISSLPSNVIQKRTTYNPVLCRLHR